MNELWSILGHFGWPDFPRKSLNRQSSIWHQPPPRLDPSTSTLPFMQTTFSAADVRPSTARTSFTQVDDEQQQQQPIPPDPTTQDVASSNVTQQVPEDRQQQSVQLPLSTLSTQSQAVFESETVPQTPQTYLTFLLISGRRRTMSFGPESSIGRVKELTWNSWPTGQYLCLSHASIAYLTVINLLISLLFVWPIFVLACQNGKMNVRLLPPIYGFCILAECCKMMKLWLVSAFPTSPQSPFYSISSTFFFPIPWPATRMSSTSLWP